MLKNQPKVFVWMALLAVVVMSVFFWKREGFNKQLSEYPRNAV